MATRMDITWNSPEDSMSIVSSSYGSPMVWSAPSTRASSRGGRSSSPMVWSTSSTKASSRSGRSSPHGSSTIRPAPSTKTSSHGGRYSGAKILSVFDGSPMTIDNGTGYSSEAPFKFVRVTGPNRRHKGANQSTGQTTRASFCRRPFKSLECACPLLYEFLCSIPLGREIDIQTFDDFVNSIPDAEMPKYGGIEYSLLQALTSYPPPCNVHTAGLRPETADVVIVQKYSPGTLHTEIYPISVYAAESKPVITDSKTLRSALRSDNPFEELQWLTPPWAVGVMQLLQLDTEAPRTERLHVLQKLVEKYMRLPPEFILDDIEKIGEHPVSGGGFADIWKGSWAHEASPEPDRRQSEILCLKVLRVFTSSMDRDMLFKECCREAVIWKQLKHRNVLPFLGVNTELFAPSFCLVSPWMGRGNVIEYLSQDPRRSRLTAILDIIKGLHYIHSFQPSLIHGDIRGANILVDRGVCRLADFGLAQVAETQGFKETYSLKGSLRWLAPELIDPSHDPDHTSSFKSWRRDMYAFGCTVYEIATLKPPFAELRTEAQVLHAVLTGERPPRLSDNGHLQLDSIWNIIEQCWSSDPVSRPSANFVRLKFLMIVVGNESEVK